MAKTGFSSLVSKVQSTANEVAGKVKSGVFFTEISGIGRASGFFAFLGFGTIFLVSE